MTCFVNTWLIDFNIAFKTANFLSRFIKNCKDKTDRNCQSGHSLFCGLCLKKYIIYKNNLQCGRKPNIYLRFHLTTGFKLCHFSTMPFSLISLKSSHTYPIFVGISQFKIGLTRHLPLMVEIKARQTSKDSPKDVKQCCASYLSGNYINID